jgi:hypothetical protein
MPCGNPVGTCGGNPSKNHFFDPVFDPELEIILNKTVVKKNKKATLTTLDEYDDVISSLKKVLGFVQRMKMETSNRKSEASDYEALRKIKAVLDDVKL